MNTNTPKTVQDVLPREAMEFDHIRKIKDKLVASSHELGWRGPHKNVLVWWTLEDGTRLGWNESPSRGWSFVTMSKNSKNWK